MSDEQKPKTGYKCPPAQHRFKPHVSGNPRGRPPKEQAAFLPTQVIRDILAVTEEERTIRTPGGTRKIRTIDAIFRRLVQRALEGHGPSLRYVVGLHEKSINAHRDRFRDEFSFTEMVEHEMIAKQGPPENARHNRAFVNDLRKRTRRT